VEQREVRDLLLEIDGVLVGAIGPHVAEPALGPLPYRGSKSPVEVMPFLARRSARLLVGLKTAAFVFLPAATGAGIVTTYVHGTRLQYGWGNEKIG
jgi:hypothetical protein